MIILEPLLHRKQLCVSIVAKFSQELNNAVRQVEGRKFSASHRCWYIPYAALALRRLVEMLQAFDAVVIRGTDLRYIQALLGHESSRITERYAHVTKRGFEQLISPLDYLFLKDGTETNRVI